MIFHGLMWINTFSFGRSGFPCPKACLVSLLFLSIGFFLCLFSDSPILLFSVGNQTFSWFFMGLYDFLWFSMISTRSHMFGMASRVPRLQLLFNVFFFALAFPVAFRRSSEGFPIPSYPFDNSRVFYCLLRLFQDFHWFFLFLWLPYVIIWWVWFSVSPVTSFRCYLVPSFFPVDFSAIHWSSFDDSMVFKSFL